MTDIAHRAEQAARPHHLRRYNMTTDEIIAGMTEAQRAAVCGCYAWASPADEDEGERELYRLGLWNPRPKWGERAITLLGLAVRARLMEEQND